VAFFNPSCNAAKDHRCALKLKNHIKEDRDNDATNLDIAYRRNRLLVLPDGGKTGIESPALGHCRSHRLSDTGLGMDGPGIQAIFDFDQGNFGQNQCVIVFDRPFLDSDRHYQRSGCLQVFPAENQRAGGIVHTNMAYGLRQNLEALSHSRRDTASSGRRYRGVRGVD
jgi:hypothetical protein